MYVVLFKVLKYIYFYVLGKLNTTAKYLQHNILYIAYNQYILI